MKHLKKEMLWLVAVLSFAFCSVIIAFLTLARLNLVSTQDMPLSGFLDALRNQDAVSAYLQSFLIYITLFIPNFMVLLSLLGKKLAISFPQGFVSNRRHFPLYIIVAILPSLFLNTYTRLPFNIPIGIDTIEYQYVLEVVFRNGLSFSDLLLSSHLTYALTFLPFFPFRMLNFSWDAIMRVAPLVLASIYVATTYALAFKLGRSLSFAFLSALFAAVSFHLLVLSTTLFRNLVGLAITNLLMLFFLLNLQKPSRKYLFLSVGLAIFLFFQYLILLLVFAFALIFFIAWFAVVLRRYSLQHVIGSTVKIFAPVICLFIISNVYNYFFFGGTMVKPLVDYVPYLADKYSIGPYNLVLLPYLPQLFSAQWFSTFTENPFLLILSTIGFFISAFHSTKEEAFDSVYALCDFLLAWSFSVSLIIVFSGPTSVYRLVVNYPTAIFAAIGYMWMVHRGKKN